jgi:hypothetical protein
MEGELLLNGIFSLLTTATFVLVGLVIATRYRKNGNFLFVLTGLAWMGVGAAWMSPSLSFLVYLFDGRGLSVEVYLIIGSFLQPVFLFLWIYVVVNLLEVRRGRLCLALHCAISVPLEAIQIWLLATDPASLGVLLDPVDIDYGLVSALFLGYHLFGFIAAGVFFAMRTLKMGGDISIFRGYTLLGAMVLFLIGAALEIVVTMPPNRIVLFASAALFYLGFVVPEPLRKRVGSPPE